MTITVKADKQQYLEFMADQIGPDGDFKTKDEKKFCIVEKLTPGAFKYLCDSLNENDYTGAVWCEYSEPADFIGEYNFCLGYAKCAEKYGHDPDVEFILLYEKYRKLFSEGGWCLSSILGYPLMYSLIAMKDMDDGGIACAHKDEILEIANAREAD